MGFKNGYEPPPPPIHPMIVRKAGIALACRFKGKQLAEMVDILGLRELLQDAEERPDQYYRGLLP